MARFTIPDGVWPTMITPFRDDGSIDYAALERMVAWYLERGVAGLFAVCQSSEMFFLSLRERLELARACVRFAGGRVPVIASGHVAETPDDQLEEARMMADTGIAALVLLSNRFARADEDDGVFDRHGSVDSSKHSASTCPSGSTSARTRTNASSRRPP